MKGVNVEKFASPVLGLIVAIVFFFVPISKEMLVPIMKDFQNIGICIFGFLITTMSIIIQGQSDTILKIKSNETLYSRIISFNKRVVSLSLIAAIYSLVFGNISMNFTCIDGHIWDIISAFFCGILFIFLYDLIYFSKIFFQLISSK